MPPMDTLTTLFSHHQWANLRLLACCQTLTPTQLAATIPGAFGSIEATLQHLVRSDRSYFTRISTGQPFPYVADAPPLTMSEMAAALHETGAGLIEWAGKVQPDDTVVVDWEGTPRNVPKTIILTQVINHATEHREQIKAILTELGIEPPDLQGWEYFAEVVRPS